MPDIQCFEEKRVNVGKLVDDFGHWFSMAVPGFGFHPQQNGIFVSKWGFWAA